VAEDFTHWDHSTQDIISSFMALTNEVERTLDLPRHGAVRACPWLSAALVAGSVRRGRGGDQYNQRRSEGGGWGSGHPRLSKGGQGEVVRRRFSIVGTFSLDPVTLYWFPNIGFIKQSNTHGWNVRGPSGPVPHRTGRPVWVGPTPSGLRGIWDFVQRTISSI